MSKLVWITWVSLKNGNDGRRTSGVGYQKTTRAHAAILKGKNQYGEAIFDGWESLCRRSITLHPRSADPDVPRCRVCERRAAEHGDATDK